MEAITSGQIGLAIGIVSLVGVAFTVYKSYRNPQVEVDTKAKLLAQQLEQTNKESDRRFTEVQNNVKDAFLLAQNHTHSVDIKVDNLTSVVSELKGEAIKISTILEERLPKK